jgi:electron transfer flavoprotein alpha subunit
MREIIVIIEHRQGEVREISLEMLSKAQDLVKGTGADLTSVILGKGIHNIAEQIKNYSHHTIVVENERLLNFNSDPYQDVISYLINKRNPFIVLIGHTAFGMDLAPSLAALIKAPLITDCYDFKIHGERLSSYRQMYGGKICADISAKESPCQIITVRLGSFPSENLQNINGSIEDESFAFDKDYSYKKFLQYIEAETGGVDITQSDVLVSIGRGIGGVENIPIAEKLANLLGGVVSCSRPVADKNWLPKERQVGTSGRTVKPKFYIALGISGAFQHISGMKNSATILAVNKDPKAPIFNVAKYGIVDDIFKVIPAIVGKLGELKGV